MRCAEGGERDRRRQSGARDGPFGLLGNWSDCRGARSLAPTKAKQQSTGFLRAINLDRLRVEVTRGRKKLLVAARQSTERELAAAREALLGRPTRRRSPARDAIRAALDAHPELRAVDIEGGDDWITFRRVPLDALDVLARALKGLKLPTPT